MPDTLLTGAASSVLNEGSVTESPRSGISWPAILGGAAGSLALALLLFTLGSGLGMASVSPWTNSGATAATVTMLSVGWLVVMHWLSSGLGGYLTGRLRTKWAGLHSDEVFFRDTANGFLCWAVASLAGAAIVTMTAAFVLSATAAVATDVAGGVAKGAAQSATAPAGASAYLLDRLFRTDRANASGSEGTAKSQTAGIILNGITTGEFPAQDKAYLGQLVAAQTGIPQEEAVKRVDQVVADAQAAEVKARQAADAARKAGATLTIVTGLAMLIGAFIACVAAALGGKRRDVHA